MHDLPSLVISSKKCSSAKLRGTEAVIHFLATQSEVSIMNNLKKYSNRCGRMTG